MRDTVFRRECTANYRGRYGRRPVDDSGGATSAAYRSV